MIGETWRGWQGHLCVRCEWHLNTLLEYNGRKYIVSTVGQHFDRQTGKYDEIAHDAFFETMVFESKYDVWDDIDVGKQLHQFTRHYKHEDEAQAGHYEVLEQVKKWLQGGRP